MRRPTELWRRIRSGVDALMRPPEGPVSDERAPDLLAPRVYESRRFRLSYPGNWGVVEAEGEGEGCSIHSPGHSLLQINIFEPTVPADEALEAHAEAFSDTLTRGFERDEVAGWGSLEARGLRLRGPLLAHVPGELRIFAAASEAATAVIIEQIYDEDRGLVRPGFAMIASSFELGIGGRR